MDGFLEVISAFVLGLGLFIIVKRYFTSKSGVNAIDESVANPPTSEANDNNDENNDLSSAAGAGRVAKKDRKRTLAARGAGATATRRSHAWLVGTLKGHCDPVLDAQLSSNGKHLATCAEEDQHRVDTSCCQVGANAVVEAATSSSPAYSVMKTGSRRQRQHTTCSTTNKLTQTNSTSSPTPPTPISSPSLSTSGGSDSMENRQVADSASDASCATTTTETSSSTKSANAVVSTSSRSRGKHNRKKSKTPATSTTATPAAVVGGDKSCSLPLAPLTPPLTAEATYRLLCGYTLPPHQLQLLGYPLACAVRSGHAYVHKMVWRRATDHNDHHHSHGHGSTTGSGACTQMVSSIATTTSRSVLHAGAKEFVPRAGRIAAAAVAAAGNSETTVSDSGGSSDSGVADDDTVSSSGSDESDSASVCGRRLTGDVVTPECVRCGSRFAVTTHGVYVQRPPAPCFYHWGRLHTATSLHSSGDRRHQCCDGRPGSRGCSRAACHVWTGLLDGLNGPLPGYVCTRPRRCPTAAALTDSAAGRRRQLPVYALDCEMCYTAGGMQLARVSVVDVDGRRVYDTLVRPERRVVDHNTRFSGMTVQRLAAATRSLRTVRSDLMGFIGADTVLVGHALDNDLRALRLVHALVIDTSVLFPHARGLPYRQRLSRLAATCLRRDIQTAGGGGHDSLEDARTSMQLLLWRVRHDLGLS